MVIAAVIVARTLYHFSLSKCYDWIFGYLDIGYLDILMMDILILDILVKDI